MKTTIPNLTYKFVFFLLLLAAVSQAQNISFGDSAFKAKLLESSPTNQIAQDNMNNNIAVDADGDGEISYNEALAVYYLDVSNPYNSQGPFITDFSMIQHFVNLRSLKCAHHQISNIDLTFLGSLWTLDCSYNNLSALDIPFAPQLQNLNCSNNQITSLDLTDFTMLNEVNLSANQLSSIDLTPLAGLQKLNIAGNGLTSIDVSGNSNLTVLDVSGNQLSSISLAGLTALQSLNIGGNQFTSIDLTPVPNLKNLDIYQNQFTSVDLSAVPQLDTFSASENQLTSVDLSSVPLLRFLIVGFNQLTTIDLSHTPQLLAILCQNNQITNLDITGLPLLGALICENNLLTTIDGSQSQLINLDCSNNPLETIFLKNGFLTMPAQTFDLSDIPNLQYICADEGEEALILQKLIDLGYGTTSVSTYCSFTPGGTYNTITGSILFDLDDDGCDMTDVPQPNLKIAITGSSASGATFSTGNGVYNFYTQTGNFTVTPEVENSSFFHFSPSNANPQFTNTNNNIATHDFCVSANGVHPDVEIVLTPINRARPGFDAEYKIVYRNKGNQILSGDVIFNYDDSILDLEDVSISPDSQTSGQLQWFYNGLRPFEVRVIFLTLNVNSPVENPAVNLDDILTYSVSVTSSLGDEMPADNDFTLNQVVVNAYDPNDIMCLEGESVDPSAIGSYLHYMVNFENLGSAEAENVVVRIEVDPELYDINSLQIMETSHVSYSRVSANVIEFIFEQINLDAAQGNPPVGGHGNVLFKIKSNNELQAGDSVTKMADIYFDYNFPIRTNDAETIFQALQVPGFTDNPVSVYPNPSNGIVHVNTESEVHSLELFDVQGRLLQISRNTKSIDLSQRSNGLYFLRIKTDRGAKVEKLIRN
jgi:Leucine-rich repeat (LRR) protein